MNNRYRFAIYMTVFCLWICAPLVFAQAHPGKKAAKAHAAAAAEAHKVTTPDQIQWGPAPNALPSGAQLAVLDGDPMKPGAYTMRLKMPDGYKVPPHSHASAEHLTVISGELHLGTGTKWDESTAQSLPPGSFAVLSPRTQHYAWAAGETVLQLHGTGPWRITYVNPSDDPRNKK